MDTTKRKQRRSWAIRLLLIIFAFAALLFFLLHLGLAKQETTLSIALYPYVPDQARFQQAVEAEWVSIPEAEDFDPDILKTLRMIQEMTGVYPAEGASAQSYESLFAEGQGRAFIGFSESMYGMGDALDRVVFHTFSLSEKDNIPLLYADIASINAKISDKRNLLRQSC